MSEEDEDLGYSAADAGIEYGGWGLLLLFFLKKLCTIARNNGIYLELTSPCRLNFKFDTTPATRTERPQHNVDEATSDTEECIEYSDIELSVNSEDSSST